jgi:hypothetical protein
MDTGLQWDTRVYLKACHWNKWICTTLCYLTAPILALLIMLTPAHASGNFPASGQGWIGVAAGCRPTILEACNYDMMPDPPYVNGCRLGNSGYWRPAGRCPLCPLNSIPLNATTCTCNLNFEPDSTQTRCVLSVTCPAHSSGTYPDACYCDTGYKLDAAKTSCVPIPDTCPIPDLTPLTDPVAIDFDNNVGSRWRPDGLTADYQTKLKCVEDAIVARGGTSEGSSAYRPEQYQRHLYEIVDKDRELKASYMKEHPECQARRDTITKKMKDHGLKRKQPVAEPGTSRHESGTAFDLTPSGLTDAQLTTVYTGCGVTNTAVSSEPWHTQ